MVVAISIPLEPRTKKNSQRIIMVGRYPRILPSKAYIDYEKCCAHYIPELHINNPVNVEAHFYMKTKRRVDLVNLQEALCDVLVKYGCVEDDNSSIICSMDGCRVLYDKENPRTEIIITNIKET